MDQLFKRLYNILKSKTTRVDDDFDLDDVDLGDLGLDDDVPEDPFESPRRERPPAFPAEVVAASRTLDVEPGSPFSTVRKRYLTLLTRHHPDRFANDPTAQARAERTTKELNAAYTVLKRFYKTR